MAARTSPTGVLAAIARRAVMAARGQLTVTAPASEPLSVAYKTANDHGASSRSTVTWRGSAAVRPVTCIRASYWSLHTYATGW
jgi:hypothetical protein